ncbi:MAG: GvpL/GvpF family gas vesicle protein [Candidatus Omnitrophota bacterium]
MNEGKYIYCIIDSNQVQSFGPLGIGGRGDVLYTVCFNDIAAVVSNSPIKKYAISSENAFAHEKAIEEVMKTRTVLPVRFATIAEDEEKIRKILAREYDKLKELFNKVRDKKELGLKAIFREDMIYKEILERYEKIKKLKQEIVSVPPAKSYYQRMEIGNLVEQALNEEKEKYKKAMLDALSPLAENVKINDTYGERMIINAAFLVVKNKEAEFDRNIQQLDEKYGDKIKFKYVGTLPPFNFVSITIETKEY